VTGVTVCLWQWQVSLCACDNDRWLFVDVCCHDWKLCNAFYNLASKMKILVL